MLVKRYGGGRVKVAASSFYKQQRMKNLPPSMQRVYHQSSAQVPPEMYTRRVRFAGRLDGRTQIPAGVNGRYYEDYYEDDEEDDDEDDEFAGLDQYPSNYRVHAFKGENDESGDRSKLIFALLVVPSLIALYSSHNKMNKGSESNIDIDALKSGAFPGFSAGPGGHSFGSMMNAHHRHLPDFEEDDIAQMVASEQEEKSSAQRYAEKLRADYPDKKNAPQSKRSSRKDEDEAATQELSEEDASSDVDEQSAQSANLSQAAGTQDESVETQKVTDTVRDEL